MGRPVKVLFQKLRLRVGEGSEGGVCGESPGGHGFKDVAREALVGLGE